MNRNLFSATIRLDAGPYTRPLAQAQKATRAFSNEADAASRRQRSFGREATAAATQTERAWSRSMRIASRAAHGFDRTLGFLERRVRGLGRVLKYNLIFGSIGLSAIFTGGITAGIKFNATMEQNETALKNFLGSTKAARKEMKILFDIAKTTPFEVPDVTDAARKFLAFGFTVNQTNKYLRTLADAAASTGAGAESMQRIVLAIGQIQAKGRVQGDELLQLTEAGIPAYRILQKELGLTKEQIGQIGKEQIPAGKAIEALMRGMGKLYGGASQAQARTFFGMWSTFKDNANQTLGAITRGLFDETKTWMQSLNRFADYTTSVFQGEGSMGSKVSKVWKRLTSGLNEWLDGGGKEQIAAGAEKMGEIFAGVLNTIFGVGGGNGEKSPFYRAGSTAVKSFAGGFKDSLQGGKILASPLARAIETYLLLRWGLKRMNKGGGGGGALADKAVDQALGQRVFWATPMPVTMIGGVGGKGPGGVPLPYPGAPGGKTPVPAPGKYGKLGKLLNSSFGRGALGLARGAGGFAAIQMALDAAFREDHNPFGTAVAIGEAGGRGLRGLFGMKNNPQLSHDELQAMNQKNLEKLRGRYSGWWIDDQRNTKAAAKQLGLNAIVPPSERRKAETSNKRSGALSALAFGFGVKDRRAVALAQSGAAGLVASFETALAQKAKAGAAGSSLAGAASTISSEVANLAGMPGAAGGPAAYEIGANAGGNVAKQMIAGAKASMAQQLASFTPFGGGMAAGNNGKVIGFPYAGTHSLGNWQSDNAVDISMGVGSPVTAFAGGKVTNISGKGGGDISSRFAGLGVTITGPNGGIFYKHLTGSGLSVGDAVSAGQVIGTSGGGNGVPHIHVGFQPPQSPKSFVSFHGGGTFRAPVRGGEGLALLRDGERISPTGASRGAAPGRTLNVNLRFSGEVGGSGSVDVEAIATRLASLMSDAADNMALVEVD